MALTSSHIGAGFRYDIETDPLNPKLLGQFECEDGQEFIVTSIMVETTHILWAVSNQTRGYILRIVDISDQSERSWRLVGRWTVSWQQEGI